MDDLPTLRARVEAAQVLAAKATPGPWRVIPMDCGDYFGERVTSDSGDVTGELIGLDASDGRLLVAAPDLVTLATDLLAMAEAQAAAIERLRAALAEVPILRAWQERTVDLVRSSDALPCHTDEVGHDYCHHILAELLGLEADADNYDPDRDYAKEGPR